MGLGSDVIDLVARLKQEGYLGSKLSVAEIGAQQLASSFLNARESLRELGGLFGVDTSCPLPEPQMPRAIDGELLPPSADHLAADAPAARVFWRWLGFDYAALDLDDMPGVTRLDLNYEDAPPEMVGQFQLVTNFGTTEHIANQLNAFNVIHDLVAPGGLMIHELPMHGMLNHGLINYNPKFFWMLARSNMYRTIYMDVRANKNRYALPENILDALGPFDTGAARRLSDYQVADMVLIAILQKVVDTPYVAPIDVPTSVKTSDEALIERYPSLFDADRFRGVAAFDGVLALISGWRLQREVLARYRRRVAKWLS
ncbi:MAG: hypothetical protein JO032_15520 [Alphaproteobacteria bacterium]|nr:hypothetical protein [Alphaproteobacteria bacterium]